MSHKQNRILVIKLSALGDFIQALGPMKAIRKNHPNDHITLMTTAPFQSLAEECGYFDDIYIDEKPRWFQPHKILRLKKLLNNPDYTRVYDLQNNNRSNLYFKLLSKKPEWVGTAEGASHQNTNPDRTKGHAFEGHCQTLALAGLKDITVDPLDWMQADISDLPLEKNFILIVSGSAPEHPYKRWPAEKYAALCNKLTEQKIQPVLIGTNADKDSTDTIAKLCEKALNLTGQTSLKQIATLAHKAKAAIGNDTGPMHIIGATGCHTISLFSGHTNPIKHAPNGNNVEVIQKDNIGDITYDEILELFLKNKSERAA